MVYGGCVRRVVVFCPVVDWQATNHARLFVCSRCGEELFAELFPLVAVAAAHLSPPNYDVGMADNDEVLVSSGGKLSGERVVAYANRLEVSRPRMLTFGLTRKTETYAYKAMRDVGVKGGTLTIHWGPLTVRRFQVGRKRARAIADLIHQGM